MRERREPIELDIESIGFEGVSVARIDGKAVLLKGGGLPGEKVKAVIAKNKKKMLEGYITEVISKAPERVEPKCFYFGTCGGCSWQNMDYSVQLQWKTQHVIDALSRIGKVEPKVIHQTLPSKQQFEYRNKMDFSFGAFRWLTPNEINSDVEVDKNFALGLHYPGKFDKIIDISECHIQPAIGNEIMNAVREKARELNVNLYDYNKHIGFLKNLLLRFSVYENAIMAILISSPAELENEIEFADWFAFELPKLFDRIKVTYHAENEVKSSVAFGEIKRSNNYALLQESILGIVFNISPFSFFQTNSIQLDSFIGKIIEYAKLENGDIVWDLYCGCGSITLPASKYVDKIIGIELNPSAVSDAIKNAEANGISNAEFYQADLHNKNIPELLETLPKPDIIIVDPPRIGMNENLINHIIRLAPKRIVYVSCNPATQARDLSMLSEHYQINEVQPIDMFPHTYHIETVAELVRKEG